MTYPHFSKPVLVPYDDIHKVVCHPYAISLVNTYVVECNELSACRLVKRGVCVAIPKNSNADDIVEAATTVLGDPGTNCIKIGLPGKLILIERKGLREVIFS